MGYVIAILLYLFSLSAQAAVAPTEVLSATDSATVTSVSSSATSVVLLAASSKRKGVILFNDSTQDAYVAFAATATTSAYTHKMAPGSFWQFDYPIYRGVISCIWASANGSMKVSAL